MFERFLNPGRVDPPDIDVDFAWDERDDVLDYVFDKYGNEHAAMVATHLTCGAHGHKGGCPYLWFDRGGDQQSYCENTLLCGSGGVCAEYY